MLTTVFQQLSGLLMADPLLLFILAVSFGVLGALLSIIFSDLLKRERSRKNWPSVPGKITASRVSKKTLSVANGAGTSLQDRYKPEVKFSYQVGGASYEGKLDTGINAWLFRGSSQNLVNHYPVGAAVPVFYNPADPKTAVLTKASFGNLVGLMSGLGVLALGLLSGTMWIVAIVGGLLPK